MLLLKAFYLLLLKLSHSLPNITYTYMYICIIFGKERENFNKASEKLLRVILWSDFS